MITLYHCNTSYASFKVRIYLCEKNIKWKSHHIDLRKQEHIRSNYREINPQGTVPALKTETGKIICGSTNIIEYLEKQHPEPVLLPQSGTQQKLVHDICMQQEALHDPYIRTLSYYYNFMSPEKRKQLDIPSLLKLAENHPSAARGDFLKRVLTNKIPDSEIETAKNKISDNFQQLDQLLEQSDSDYLIGDNYSIADIVCIPALFRMHQLNLDHLFSNYQKLNQWWQLMQQRSCFKTAILDYLKYPHRT